MSEDERWTRVLPAADLERGWVTPARVGSRDIAIYDAANGVFASLGYCTHGGALLCDGYFDGHLIECPLHQGCFDVRTGEPKGAPATRKLRVLPARIRDGFVEVRMGGVAGKPEGEPPGR